MIKKLDQQLDHNDQDQDTTDRELGFDQDDQFQQETTHNGRLSFKLKIRKPESAMEITTKEEEENCTPFGYDYPKSCEICNRGFSNDKDYRYHMKMHYQEQKMQNKKVINLVQNQVLKGEKEVIDTPVTKWATRRKRSQNFSIGSSSDLLPGSMDRIDQMQRTDSSSTLLETTSLHECSVTEKKAQEDPMIEYAEILLMLAEPKSEPNVTLPPFNSENSSLTKNMKGLQIVENKAQIHHSPKRVDKGKGKAVLEFDDKFCLPLKLEEEYSDTKNSERSELGNSKKKVRRKLKLDELEETDYDNINEEDQMEKKKKNSDRCEYKCNKCERTFQTYQALGGHFRSHNKKQRIKNKNSAKSSISAMEEDRPRVALNFDLNDFPSIEDERIDH